MLHVLVFQGGEGGWVGGLEDNVYSHQILCIFV